MRKVVILSASFLIAFNACKKEGELTPDFVENTSLAFFSDSTVVESITRIGDSVLADKVSTGLVGVYRDSSFGKTNADLYMQPLLPTNALVFSEPDETTSLDSIVLSLEYSGHFGDTTIPQTFDVFRLTESLDFEESYYSDTSIQTEATSLGSVTFTPTPNTKTTINQPNNSGGIDTVEVTSQLRIKLSAAFGNELLSKSGGAELVSNSSFTEFFKGVKVVARDNGSVANNENSILYFRLTATNTKMSLYYKQINSQLDTTNRVVDFPVNTSSVRFNTFKHDYSNSGVNDVLQNPGASTKLAYTEAMASVETVIRFPKLKDAFKKKILVNKAELILPVYQGSYDKFGVASSIIVATRDNTGSLQFIPDSFESTEYFGGTYDESNQRYRFNITRYVQGLLNGSQSNNGLTVLVTGSAVKAERVVFLNENNTGNKFQLNLYYTNTQ